MNEKHAYLYCFKLCTEYKIVRRSNKTGFIKNINNVTTFLMPHRDMRSFK